MEIRHCWNVKTEGDTAYIDIFGELDEDFILGLCGISSRSFLDEIRQLDPNQKLEITLNSPGGSVATGLSIYELIKAHKGEVTIKVAGLACSAATLITSAPNAKVIVSEGSLFMIHRVSGGSYGTSEDLTKDATTLEKLDDMAADIYVSKTGRSKEEILQKMREETYFTAKEAVDFGLADVLDTVSKVTNSLEDGSLRVNGLTIAPEIVKGLPKAFVGVEAVKASMLNPKKEKLMDLEQLKAECPDLVEQISAMARAEGARAERQRISEIEAVALPGFENLIATAKFDGKTTAAELSVQIVKAQMQRKDAISAQRTEDAADLNAIRATDSHSGLNEDLEKSVIELAKKSFNK